MLLPRRPERPSAAPDPLPRRRAGGALRTLGEQILEVSDLLLQDFVLRLQLRVLDLQVLRDRLELLQPHRGAFLHVLLPLSVFLRSVLVAHLVDFCLMPRACGFVHSAHLERRV